MRLLPTDSTSLVDKSSIATADLQQSESPIATADLQQSESPIATADLQQSEEEATGRIETGAFQATHQ